MPRCKIAIGIFLAVALVGVHIAQADVEVWVPTLLAMKASGPEYSPDIPKGLKWTTDECPRDYTQPGCPPLLSYYSIIVPESELPKLEAHLAAKDQRVRHATDMPEKDLLALRMYRLTRRNAYFVKTGAKVPAQPRNQNWPFRAVTGGRVYYMPPPATNITLVTADAIDAANAAGRLDDVIGDKDHLTDEFFDSIPMKDADAARKLMVKELVIQSYYRGVKRERAEAICTRLGLPTDPPLPANRTPPKK